MAVVEGSSRGRMPHLRNSYNQYKIRVMEELLRLRGRVSARLRSAPAAAGLRAAKKARTRPAISDIATRLFCAHGFEEVTVAQIAAAADVSVKTVFNYFPTKEDLFFDRADDLLEVLVAAITERPPGETIVGALHRLLAENRVPFDTDGLAHAARPRPLRVLPAVRRDRARVAGAAGPACGDRPTRGPSGWRRSSRRRSGCRPGIRARALAAMVLAGDGTAGADALGVRPRGRGEPARRRAPGPRGHRRGRSAASRRRSPTSTSRARPSRPPEGAIPEGHGRARSLLPVPAPPPRRNRAARLAHVVSTERRSPHLVRVVLGGEGLAGFGAGAFTDHYVKLQIPPPGAAYTAPFDAEEVKATLPREQWPRTRTYTVRAWDAGARRADDRLRRPRRRGRRRAVGGGRAARRRAAAPRPRRRLHARPDADWHLLVGDRACCPRSPPRCRGSPPASPVHVLVEVDGPEDESRSTSPGDLRADLGAPRAAAGRCSSRRVRALELPPGARPRVRPRRGERRCARCAATCSPSAACRRRGAVGLRLLEAHAHRGGLARGQGGVEPPGRGGPRRVASRHVVLLPRVPRPPAARGGPLARAARPVRDRRTSRCCRPARRRAPPLASGRFAIDGAVDASAHVVLGRAARAARSETFTRRHPLRDEVVQARHDVDGRLGRHAARRRRHRGRATSPPAATAATRRTCRSRTSPAARRGSRTSTTASRWRPSTAARRGCWSRTCTSGRAPSGCAG